MKKSWNLANFILNLVIFLISWVRTVKQNVSSVFQCNKKSRQLLILPRLLIIILFNNVMVLCIIYTYSYPIPHCACQVKQFVLLVSCMNIAQLVSSVMYSQSTWLVLCTASLPTQCYVQIVYLQIVLCTDSLLVQCYVQLDYLAFVMYSKFTRLVLYTAS